MATNTIEHIQIQITPDKKPIEKLVGTVSKEGTYRGNRSEKSYRYPPKQFIPFTYTAYVQKIYEKEAKKGEGEVYKGKIKFLDITEAGGEHMEIRYLKNCPSLDRQYQEKHNYKPADEKDGVGDLYFGATTYDIPVLPTNEMYRLFIEHSPYNGDNKNRPKNFPIYFKIRNGAADVDARKAKINHEKKVAEFKSKIAEDDNIVETYTIVYGRKRNIELNARRDNLMQQFDTKNGAETMMKDGENYFTNLKNTFQFYLNQNILVVAGEDVIHNADKKSLELGIDLGADKNRWSENFVNACISDYKLLTKWVEIDKELNKNN
jgi:hypothetical protein